MDEKCRCTAVAWGSADAASIFGKWMDEWILHWFPCRCTVPKTLALKISRVAQQSRSFRPDAAVYQADRLVAKVYFGMGTSASQTASYNPVCFTETLQALRAVQESICEVVQLWAMQNDQARWFQE